MTKIVSLSENAYNELAGMKNPGESFSGVVLRVVAKEKKKSIREFFDMWKDDKKIGKSFDEILEMRHKMMPRDVKL